MVSQGLRPIKLRFKGLYFGSYQDIQHEFSDCRDQNLSSFQSMQDTIKK